MWKWVIRDYFAVFRWENMKYYLWKEMGWWSILYFLVIIPLQFRVWEHWQDGVVYFCIVPSMLFPACFQRYHQLKLPKMLFVAPMRETERRTYITRYGLFRILCNVALAGVGVVIMASLRRVDVISAVLILTNAMYMEIALCGLQSRTLPPRQRELMNTNVTVMAGGWETLSMIVSLFVGIGIACMLCLASEYNMTWLKWTLTGVNVLIQLPITVKLLRGWSDMLDRAVSYEKSYL